MEILLNVVFMGLVIVPCLTLLHELGHASAALLLTDSDVTVILGAGSAIRADAAYRLAWKWGRLQFVLHPFSTFFGFCRWGKSDSWWKTILICGAGPLFSLAAAALIWLLDTAVQPELGVFDNLPQWAGGYAFIVFLLTALPLRYPSWWGAYKGRDSDGMRIYRLLNHKQQ